MKIASSILVLALVALMGCQGSTTTLGAGGLATSGNASNNMRVTPTGYESSGSGANNHLTGGAEGQETLQSVPVNSAMLSPLVASFIDTGNTSFTKFEATYGPPLVYTDDDGNPQVIVYVTSDGNVLPVIPPLSVTVEGFNTDSAEVIRAEAERLAAGLVPIALAMEETKRIQFVEGVTAWNETVGAALEAALSALSPL